MPKLQTMNEDLQNYVKTKSFIDSSDTWFWKKLRYHLSRGSKKSSHQDKESKSENRASSFCRQISTDLLLCRSTKFNEDLC